MKIKDIISLDFRKQENRDIIYEKALELPFFDSISDLDVEALERAINKMESKYPIAIGYILRSKAEERHMTAMIKESKNQQHICTIYALNIRELFLKACIFEYAYIKKNFKESGK